MKTEIATLQVQVNNVYTKSEINSKNTSLQTQINNVLLKNEFYDSGWKIVNSLWNVRCRRVGKLLFVTMSTGGDNFSMPETNNRYDLGDMPFDSMGILGVKTCFVAEAFGTGTLLIGFKRNASVEFDTGSFTKKYLYVNAVTTIDYYK